jgi:hypothetical protein
MLQRFLSGGPHSPSEETFMIKLASTAVIGLAISTAAVAQTAARMNHSISSNSTTALSSSFS